MGIVLERRSLLGYMGSGQPHRQCRLQLVQRLHVQVRDLDGLAARRWGCRPLSREVPQRYARSGQVRHPEIGRASQHLFRVHHRPAPGTELLGFATIRFIPITSVSLKLHKTSLKMSCSVFEPHAEGHQVVVVDGSGRQPSLGRGGRPEKVVPGSRLVAWNLWYGDAL